jgi:riboflavin kinase / FMN adenylyltransferase
VNVVRSLEGVTRDPSSVVTVGTFDGVHRAHREILREVVDRARKTGGRSVVVTFQPHPRQVVGGGTQPVRLLTTVREREELLGTCGIDLLVLLHFTPEFSRQTPREFFAGTVVGKIGVREAVVGYDHMFGRDRRAGSTELAELGKEFGFSVVTLPPFAVEGKTVSSTAVRTALDAGDATAAGTLLGYPYALSGRVVRGDGRGRTIGYPTANIIPEDPAKLVPARGVYVVGFRQGGVDRFGMMNIGVRPTISPGGSEKLEVHVFDFEGDLYGAAVTVTFLHRLREERTFATLDELAGQLHADHDHARKLLAQRQA